MDEATGRQIYKQVECLLYSGATPLWPAHVDEILSRFADDVLGADWKQNPDVLARLEEAVAAVLKDQVEPTVPEWTADKYMAYLLALGPLHFHKVCRALLDILRTGQVVKEGPLRVLDVGCGPGVASLSVLYFLDCLADAYDIVDVMGEERKVVALLTPLDASAEALELYKGLVWTYQAHFQNMYFEVGAPLVHRLGDGDNLGIFGSERYDLVVLSHVLGEMRDHGLDWRAQLTCDLAGLLDEGGSLVLVESMGGASIPQINQLKSRIVSKGLDLYAPCAHIGGKPAGPICFTCMLSRLEEVPPPPISRAFLGAVRGPTYRDLAARNAWAYGVFRKDGRIHHPPVDTPVESLLAVVKQAAAGTSAPARRGGFTVQIAKSEATPIPHYKICDQTAKTDACVLAFPPEAQPMCFDVGDVVRLDNVLVEYRKPPGAESLKAAVLLVVDEDTHVQVLTSPTSGGPR
jgi:SAM-dependent methyltransferase